MRLPISDNPFGRFRTTEPGIRNIPLRFQGDEISDNLFRTNRPLSEININVFSYLISDNSLPPTGGIPFCPKSPHGGVL
jgi:hypothetical protein